MVLSPLLCAAIDFSRNPPIGKTLPLSVTSPVIPTQWSTFLPLKVEIIAVAIVIPADGPSLGIAPSGTWICKSLCLKTSGLISNFSAFVLT